MRSDETMDHRSKGKHLTQEKLDRAQQALATLLRCDEVRGFAVQDLERALHTIQGLYTSIPPDERRRR